MLLDTFLILSSVLDFFDLNFIVLGTVLSLNGHRRYFCMYHAKHPEASRRPGYYTSSGAFMGFDSEDNSSDTEDIERAKPAPVLDSPDHLPIFEDQLLDGLQMWMDRLFEGSTYRYKN